MLLNGHVGRGMHGLVRHGMHGVPRCYEHKKARLVFCWLETMHASLPTSLDAHKEGLYAVQWLGNPEGFLLE